MTKNAKKTLPIDEIDNKINAAFYGRCAGSLNASIIENQRNECYALARSQNATIKKEYIDPGASGRTGQRPQFQQLMEDVKKGLYDVVYIYSADRFSRSMPDFIKYQNELKEAGCKLVSVRGDIPSDIETSLMSVSISKTLENAHRRLPIWKVILLVILWPIGLYVLYKKIRENR